uniref:Uncharacterized protein n=1 Tax=Anguilla anguilla TaxID=7936 RepID=A0A0E9UQA7_ANGAN
MLLFKCSRITRYITDGGIGAMNVQNVVYLLSYNIVYGVECTILLVLF